MSVDAGTPVAMDEIAAPATPHRSDLWYGYRLRGLQQNATAYGVAWAADVLRDGVHVGRVEDAGDGGPIRVRSGTRAAEAAADRAVTEWAEAKAVEAFELVAEFMLRLSVIAELDRARTPLGRVPHSDGPFWRDLRFRRFPAQWRPAEWCVSPALVSASS